MHVRENIEKSRNTVFFQWFVAPEGRKVGSPKRQVRSHLAKWEMKNWTPLWREAHFEVKSVKNWRSRTTFGSSDVVSRGRRKGLCTFDQMWGFCSNCKNDGRRGTFEEDLERCSSRGRRSTRDMLIRDIRSLAATCRNYNYTYNHNHNYVTSHYTHYTNYTTLTCSYNYNYATWHYNTLEYTDTTLYYNTVRWHYAILHYSTLHHTTLHYITLH